MTSICCLVNLRFDIYSFGFDTEEDEMGMLQSARLINQLITAEVDSGTDPSRIVLGGFSQGAAMSLLTGLTGERKLAGIAALSGWLPLRSKFKAVGLFPPCLDLPDHLDIHTMFVDGLAARSVRPCFLGSRIHRPPRQATTLQRLDRIPYQHSRNGPCARHRRVQRVLKKHLRGGRSHNKPEGAGRP